MSTESTSASVEFERYGNAYIERRGTLTRAKGRFGGLKYIYDVYRDGQQTPVVYGTDRLDTARRTAKAANDEVRS